MSTIALVSACLSIGLGAWLGQRLISISLYEYRRRLTEKARSELSDLFVFVDLTHLWPTLICLSFGLALLFWWVTGSAVLAGFVGGTSFVAPRWLLTRAIRNRQRDFDLQMPDLMLSLSSALRAGASVAVALRYIVEEASPPLSQELGLVLREQRMGVEFSQSLHRMYRRMPSENVELLVITLTVGTRSGASLADLLERLCSNLRARQHLEKKIEVLTTQGKMQAWIMGSLPVVLLIVLWQLDPVAGQLLHSSSIGRAVLVSLIVLECLGIYFLNRILAIRV